MYAHLRELAARNVSAEDELTFLGAGMYDHYVPALVDSIISRSEFLTPYTPYQPEVSQGALQVMFEYQTAICELTGLPVSNATLYEGPSALGAAGYLARQHHRRTRFLVSRGVHPHARETLRHDERGLGHRGRRRCRSRDGVTDAGRAGRRARRRRLGRVPRSSRTSSARSRTSRRSRRARQGRGALAVVLVRPDDARRAAPARRLRRRHRGRRGPAARQPARLRRPVVRLLRRPARRSCAACRAGSRARRPTSTAAAASC